MTPNWDDMRSFLAVARAETLSAAASLLKADPTAGFGPGMVAGVLLGSFFAAGVTGQIKLRGFDKTSDMPRYLLGSVLVGFGGVLAGGCSVGAGLSGASNLSIAALLALAAMIFGARVTAKLLERTPGLPAIA